MQLAYTKTGEYIPITDHGQLPRGIAALDPQSQQIAGIAATAATTTTSILAALGKFGSLGGPIGAAVAGLAAVGIAVANAFAGCGDTCVEASNIANQVGQILTDNLNHYMSAPVHYRSLQLAALNNYDIAWRALVRACGVAQLQQAGVNCIADRQQGACKWKSSPGGWQQQNGQWVYVSPGQAGSGDSCWNYFVGMRDPIANDPTVVPDPTPETQITGSSPFDSMGASLSSALGGSAMPLLLIGGGVLAVVLLMGDSK